MNENDERGASPRGQPSAKGDYLWDKTGPPDPEVERLESLLGGLRYQARPAIAPVVELRPPGRALAPRAAAWAAAAALALIAGRAAMLAPPGTPSFAKAGAPVTVEGSAAQIGNRSATGSGTLPIGEWLSTGAGSQARIEVANLGSLQVKEQSRIRVLEATAGSQHFELARGSIHASVLAPPRLLVVDTPGGSAVDLGCAYTLHVANDGSGSLAVDSGSVNLEHEECGSPIGRSTGAPQECEIRVAFVPAGAVCETKPGIGPGTPRFTDAPAELHHALDRIDFERGGADDLATVLAYARKRDSLSLYHLLQRFRDGASRSAIQTRLEEIAPPPDAPNWSNAVARDEQEAWRERLAPAWSSPETEKRPYKF